MLAHTKVQVAQLCTQSSPPVRLKEIQVDLDEGLVFENVLRALELELRHVDDEQDLCLIAYLYGGKEVESPGISLRVAREFSESVAQGSGSHISSVATMAGFLHSAMINTILEATRA